MAKYPDKILPPLKYDLYECHMIIDCGSGYRCIFYISFYNTSNHKHKQIIFYNVEWELINSDQDEPIICLEDDEVPVEIYLPVVKALANALEDTTSEMTYDGKILCQESHEDVKNGDYLRDYYTNLYHRANCSHRYIFEGICDNEEKGNCKRCEMFNLLNIKEKVTVTIIEPGYCSAIDWTDLFTWDFCVFIEYPIEDWLADIQAEMIISNTSGQWVVGNWEIFIDPITMKDRITSKTLTCLEKKQKAEYQQEFDLNEPEFTPSIRFIPDPH